MPDLSPDARAAMAYWPHIEYAAATGMTTADLWSHLQDAAEELGLASPGVTVQGVSQLRGLATSIQRSGREFERAGDDLNLRNVNVPEAPWARPLSEQNALNIFQVRYQHTTITPEGPETNWRTSVFTGKLPRTVGELREAIEQDARQLANKYGQGHSDLSSVQVLSV